MYFNYGGSLPGGDASIGAPAADEHWFLAEGYTGENFHTWLLLANPTDNEAQVKVAYLREQAGPLEQSYTLAPHSRTSIHVNDVPDLGQTGVSMQVTSTNGVGIVAERAMYFDYQGLKGGSEGLGITNPETQWFLAEGYTGTGFDTWLLLANPSDADAQVNVDYLLEGRDKVTRQVAVPAHTRYTINVDEQVPAGNISMQVTSTNGVGIVAERAMYFDYHGKKGGHASAGSTQSSTEWELRRRLYRQRFRHLAAAGQPGRG